MNPNLFSDLPSSDLPVKEQLGPGAAVLRHFALSDELLLSTAIQHIAALAPFRNMVTPRGSTMSVAMTNCGALGWISDQRGYRYAPTDPETNHPWPPMPPRFLEIATTAAAQAGFPTFLPDACLINRYAPGAKLTLHQDRDEVDFAQPIVSVSLGLPAVFLFGGMERADKVQRMKLESGDVVVWGGPDRLRYHGIMPLKDGNHPSFGAYRFNLTFRKAG